MDATQKLANELADLRRRLEGLERGSQLANSSIRVGNDDINVVAGLQTGISAAQRADDARSQAEQAAQNATVALEAANGKNTVTWSPNSPSGLGKAQGDLWMQRNTSGSIVGSFEWTGSEWKRRNITDQVIENLTAGKITTGSLNAGVQIIAGDPNGARIMLSSNGFYKVEANGSTSIAFVPGGDAIFTGTITGSQVVSSDYVESMSGWRLAPNGRAEIARLQVNDTLTVGSLNASNITLSGQGVDSLIGGVPKGLIAQGFNDSQNIQNVTSLEQGIAELGFTVQPGRGYEITIDGPEYGTSEVNTIIGFRARITLDGSAPGSGSTQLRNFGQEPGGFSAGRFFNQSFLWYPSVSAATTVRMLFTFGRVAGSGTVGVNCTGERRVQIYVADIGPALPNGMEQNNSGGSGATPAPTRPTQSYSETFYATWGASYRENGSRRALNEQGFIWQGQAPGNEGGHGNQRGLVGFDTSYIRGKVPPASVLKSAKLYGRAGHTYYNSGGVFLTGSHKQTSPPATFPFGAVNERRASTPVPDGGWFVQDVLGVMREMIDGSAEGIAVGAAPNGDPSYYAYFYNYPHTDRPRIVCTWEV